MTIRTKFFDSNTEIRKDLKNHAPWRDANLGFSVLEADAMTTMPRRQGFSDISFIQEC
jgi:hypothetical protein